jgi:hypothetical protein
MFPVSMRQSQQIRVFAMFRRRLAQPRPRVDRFQTHQPQQPTNPLLVDRPLLLPQPLCHPPYTVKRRPQILLIEQPYQGQVFLVHRLGRVVQTAAGQAQQLTLLTQRQPVVFRLH